MSRPSANSCYLASHAPCGAKKKYRERRNCNPYPKEKHSELLCVPHLDVLHLTTNANGSLTVSYFFIGKRKRVLTVYTAVIMWKFSFPFIRSPRLWQHPSHIGAVEKGQGLRVRLSVIFQPKRQPCSWKKKITFCSYQPSSVNKPKHTHTHTHGEEIKMRDRKKVL